MLVNTTKHDVDASLTTCFNNSFGIPHRDIELESPSHPGSGSMAGSLRGVNCTDLSVSRYTESLRLVSRRAIVGHRFQGTLGHLAASRINSRSFKPTRSIENDFDPSNTNRKRLAPQDRSEIFVRHSFRQI